MAPNFKTLTLKMTFCGREGWKRMGDIKLLDVFCGGAELLYTVDVSSCTDIFQVKFRTFGTHCLVYYRLYL